MADVEGHDDVGTVDPADAVDDGIDPLHLDVLDPQQHLAGLVGEAADRILERGLILGVLALLLEVDHKDPAADLPAELQGGPGQGEMVLPVGAVPQVQAARAVDRIPEILLGEGRQRVPQHLRVQLPAEDEAGPIHADLDGGVAQPPGEPQLLLPPLPTADRQAEIRHQVLLAPAVLPAPAGVYGVSQNPFSRVRHQIPPKTAGEMSLCRGDSGHATPGEQHLGRGG